MFLQNCLDQYDAVLSCVADEPVTSFECVDKKAFPRETTCVDEYAELTSCIEG
jgi:hypothetical protein